MVYLSAICALRTRIRSHYAGTADGSTLRLTLGCLLESQLGIRLRKTKAGRFTFHEGEAALSEWMAENAFVAWLATPSPWEVEELAIRELDLPPQPGPEPAPFVPLSPVCGSA